MDQNDIMEIKERLALVEQKVDDQCDRCHYVSNDIIDKVKQTNAILENMRSLTQSIATLTEQVKHMNSDLGTIKLQIKEVTNKPAEKWNLIINTIVTATTSGLVAFVISTIINK